MMQPSYKTRYVNNLGEIITKEQYDLATSPVFIAAFVGCTYHCG
jgi:hypothetical protein